MATQITAYTGNIPNRESDIPTVFSANVYQYTNWIDTNFVPEHIASITSFNSDVTTFNTTVTDGVAAVTLAGTNAESDLQDVADGYVVTQTALYNNTVGVYNDTVVLKSETQVLRDQALAGSNYQGVWSAGTYALSDTVSYNGTVWISDIASNTSEPSVANWTPLSSASPINLTVAAATYTTGNLEILFVDTTSNAITITLPLNPSEFDKVKFYDLKSNFSINNLTIARNGETIMGLSEDLIVDTDNIAFELVYSNSDWRIG